MHCGGFKSKIKSHNPCWNCIKDWYLFVKSPNFWHIFLFRLNKSALARKLKSISYCVIFDKWTSVITVVVIFLQQYTCNVLNVKNNRYIPIKDMILNTLLFKWGIYVWIISFGQAFKCWNCCWIANYFCCFVFFNALWVTFKI